MREQDPIPEDPAVPDASDAMASAATAVIPSAETVETHEVEKEETPMLDVHPAHHAASTWKEFFVHIATIVLGLLIAVGLEQTVEYLHHRHEIAETHEALRREHDLNVALMGVKVEEYRRMTPLLETDLAIFQYLQRHPGAPAKDWPGRFSWYNYTVFHVDSAWKTAQQDNILVLMPAEEVRRDAELYELLQIVTDGAWTFKKALYETQSFTTVEPDPSHLSPATIDREIDLMKTLLLDHFLEGGAQANLSGRFPEFPAPGADQFNVILRNPIDPNDRRAVAQIARKVAAIGASEPGAAGGP